MCITEKLIMFLFCISAIKCLQKNQNISKYKKIKILKHKGDIRKFK